MILVTGGTGHLGRDLVPKLLARYGQVRVLARQAGTAPGVEWAQGDLATGEGLGNALKGVETIVHAATFSPIARSGRIGIRDFFTSPSSVDETGTGRLLRAAKNAGVGHFLFVSIVGLEDGVLPYSRVKLAGEALVRSSDLPWTVVRATPFFYLVRSMLLPMLKRRVAFLPAVPINPVDTGDVAEYLASCVAEGARGARDEIGGPETLPLSEFGRQLHDHLGSRSRIVPVPMSEGLGRKLGLVRSSAGQVGRTRWRDWLAHADGGREPGSPDATVAGPVSLGRVI